MANKGDRLVNILFAHEIPWMRDPIFEPHVWADMLSLRGHNVYAVDYGATRYQETDIARVYPGAKVRLIRPPSFGLGRLSYGFLYYYVVDKVLREEKIDAIILYSAPTNGIQTILAAKRLGIPVVFRSIDVLHKLVPKALALPTKLAESWVYRHVDRILTITPALSRYVVKLGANPDKVGILPLGIDTRCLALHLGEAREGLWGKTGIICQTIVFAGTLPPFSGLDILIGQMPGIIARIPGLRLLIVGDGKQRPKLEQMIQELGLGEQVKITGMVSHSEVPYYIQQADACVNTFPDSGATRDILPTKVLQYMSGDKPVVSNPLRGMLDIGIGRKQGVVYVENNNWETAIRTALTSKANLGADAREYVVNNHSYDKVIEQLEWEIETLIQKQPRK